MTNRLKTYSVHWDRNQLVKIYTTESQMLYLESCSRKNSSRRHISTQWDYRLTLKLSLMRKWILNPKIICWWSVIFKKQHFSGFLGVAVFKTPILQKYGRSSSSLRTGEIALIKDKSSMWFYTPHFGTYGWHVTTNSSRTSKSHQLKRRTKSLHNRRIGAGTGAKSEKARRNGVAPFLMLLC